MTNEFLDRSRNDSASLLDVIRILASQAVCIGHALYIFVLWDPIAAGYPYMQNIAVIVFFVLSGLVIGNLLLDRHSSVGYTFRTYSVDRTARIYSAYLPAILLIALIDIFRSSYFQVDLPHANWRAFWGNILAMQNCKGNFCLHVPSYGSAGHLWTLSVEFHIYLFIGALWFFFTTGKSQWRYILLAWMLSSLPLAFLYGSTVDEVGRGLFMAWLFGMLGAFAFRARLAERVSKKVAITVMVLIGVYYWKQLVPGHEFDPRLYPLVVIEFFGLIILAQKSKLSINWPQLQKIAITFASYSFSLYLLHHSILLLMKDQFGSGWRPFIAGVLCANVTAFFFAYFTERNYRKLAISLNSKLEDALTYRNTLRYWLKFK